ncbi:MAG: acetyl-CoA carboxylase biotin carboxyl carrier protein subunit [Myxococcales bacterium]|nr:acetyl-CoA carboxylase biotin carboxyl carrier protein subunit [Myxococcales bacterium]
MHYTAIIQNSEVPVEISELSPGHYRIVIEDRVYDIDAQFISETTLSIMNNNQSHRIDTEENPDGGFNLRAMGQILHVDMLDMRALRLRHAQEATANFDGPLTINSPMPGKVVKILVEEGQEVSEGDGLLVIEAMKIENELRAPKSGIVKTIQTSEGNTVESGSLLCIVE